MRLTIHVPLKHDMSQSWTNDPMLLPLNAKPPRRHSDWSARKTRGEDKESGKEGKSDDADDRAEAYFTAENNSSN